MSNAPQQPEQKTAQLEQMLREGDRTHQLLRLRNGVILLVALALLVGGYFFWRDQQENGGPKYQTAAVTQGTLVVTVSATGNLQPTNQVDVGSELSGIVEKVLVDDNDQVKKGQILAQLDLSKLQDAVARSKANLAQAQSQVQLMQATVAEAQANLARLQRVAKLSGGQVPSKAELDVADANLKRARASVASAQANVQQARAAVQTDETNLAKATIRSPIDGIVLSRKVEPGQTVAASFQAPVMFTLAQSLSQMELQVDIDEADVGQVHAGQPATFSVDAWPGRVFKAVITRVSYGSQVKDGVVSYPAILKVDNDDLSLRPGMTGTADITTLTHKNALLIPNAALRFTPPVAIKTARSSGGLLGALMFRRHSSSSKPVEEPKASDDYRQIWVQQQGRAEPVRIKTGATNGRVTEVLSGDLKPGMAVITEMAAGQK